MRRAVCFIMAALMACAFFASCTDRTGVIGSTEPAGGREVLVGDLQEGFPLTESPATLKIMITAASGKDQGEVYVWKKYEEMTGVDVKWVNVTKESRTEDVYTALTNKQQYDLIMRCKLSATQLIRYGKSGLILDLKKDGLLQRCAPNCWAYLETHPDTLASVMNPDGTIYALPQVNSGAELRVGVKLFVNRKWLERTNMELPSTTDELRALLSAFRDTDANGNGDPSDEIPFASVDWTNAKLALYGAFGLANRGFHNTTVDADPNTGKVRYIEGSEGYRAFLEYMHGLYEDGLMDKNILTATLDQWLGYINADRIGVFPMTNLALMPVDKQDDWVALDEALTGPAGDKLWSAIRANFHSTGAAVIPATASDPELVLRWLDYFWTDEGTLFYHMGVEGETFEAREDGSYDYMPKIYEEMAEKNLSFDEAVSEYSPYPGGNNPTVEIAPYFMGGEMAEPVAKAARSLMEYGPKEYWPGFTFTEEENDILDALKGDIGKYTESMRESFISGARPLEEWDAYVAQLEKMGVDKMLGVYQAAVDRYHALSTALN